METNETQVTPEQVEALRVASAAAKSAEHSAEERRATEVWDAKRKAEQEVMEKWSAVLAPLRTAAVEAGKAYREARVALALTGHGCPVPLGTKLHKWERVSSSRWGAPKAKVGARWRATGEWGVVEVLTDLNSIADRLANDRFSFYPGAFVLRSARKDGSLGKMVLKVNADCSFLAVMNEAEGRYYQSEVWLASGVDANAQDVAANPPGCSTCGKPLTEMGFCSGDCVPSLTGQQ